MTQSPHLTVLFPFVGHRLGGSKISAMELMASLRARGHRVLASVHRDGPLREELERRGITVQIVEHLRGGDTIRPSSYARFLAHDVRRYVTFIREASLDVVHTNDNPLHPTWGVAARLAGVAHVWHQRQRGWPRGLYGPVIPPTAVVVPSTYVRELLPRRMQERVVLAPNPVSAPQGRQLVEGANRSSVCRLVWVGNLNLQKRPGHALGALQQLTSTTDDAWRLTMIGDERQVTLAHLEAEASVRSLTDHISLAGRVSPARAIELIAENDILLATGEGESFGRTLVEALAVGTRVVAYDSGAHREVLERLPRHGWELVNDGDVRALALAVVAAYRAGPIAPHAQMELLAAIHRHYAVDTHAETLVALYRAAVGGLREHVTGSDPGIRSTG